MIRYFREFTSVSVKNILRKVFRQRLFSLAFCPTACCCIIMLVSFSICTTFSCGSLRAINMLKFAICFFFLFFLRIISHFNGDAARSECCFHGSNLKWFYRKIYSCCSKQLYPFSGIFLNQTWCKLNNRQCQQNAFRLKYSPKSGFLSETDTNQLKRDSTVSCLVELLSII